MQSHANGENRYTYEFRLDFIYCSNFFTVDIKQVNVDWVTWELSTSLIEVHLF